MARTTYTYGGPTYRYGSWSYVDAITTTTTTTSVTYHDYPVAVDVRGRLREMDGSITVKRLQLLDDYLGGHPATAIVQMTRQDLQDLLSLARRYLRYKEIAERRRLAEGRVDPGFIDEIMEESKT